MIDLLSIENYNPAALFEHVLDYTHTRSDAQLAKMLGVAPPAICKIRHKKVRMTADMLIRLHDATGKSLDELRGIAGIPKTNTKTQSKGE